MTTLNEANALYLGAQAVDAVYLGSDQVWQLPSLTLSGTPVTAGEEFEHGIGSSYTGFTVTASGGTPPYKYCLASGSDELPNGITINADTGLVSGTPGFESAGAHNIIVMAIDSVGAIGRLTPFTLTIAFRDPYYSNVKLLVDYDAPNNSAVINDQKFGYVGTVGSNARFTTDLKPYGTSSIVLDGGGDNVLFSDNPNYSLGAAPFTIDFTVLPLSISAAGAVTFMLAKFGTNAPQLSWAFSFSSGGIVAFNCSTTGSDNLSVVATATGAISAGVWSRWRVDYTGTVYRIYKNGTMVAKATGTHTKATVSQPLAIGSNSSATAWFLPGYCRGIRLTVGTARTASDSGYVISNRAFPFLPI